MPPLRHAPRIPDGLRFYVVADIHGHGAALADVLARIDDDIAEHPEQRAFQIFLGDYIDRGPGSRQVLDRLIARARTHEILMLKGNHEALFLSFFENPSVLENWRHHGALQTLISYGLRPPLNPNPTQQYELASRLAQACPIEHRLLLTGLPTRFVCGDYCFVHAGLRPGRSIQQQAEEDLLWIREDFLQYEGMFEKFVVHGHTPVRDVEVLPNRTNLDTAAYATGKLACLVLQGAARSFI
jgi:serine/threonine protein phosphatase 1